MSDDPDVRVQRALAHVLPSPAAAADLADALATATQAPPRGARPVLWVGLTVAAVLILAVGGAVLWRVPGSGHGARKIVAAPLDGRTVRVHVDAEGIVVLDDLRGAMLVTVDLGGTQTRASDGLAVLERALVELAANAPRDLNRVSTLALELVPSPNARWRWMQWIMQVAANPNVQIDRIRFGAEGSDGPPIEQHLPGDATQTTIDGSKSVGVVVTLLEPSLQPGVVRISLGGRAGPAWAVHLGSAPAPTEFGVVEIKSAVADLRAALRASAADARTSVFGQIEVPPPRGDGVTYEVVSEVLRAFREAGINDVRFNGTARPKPQEGTPPR